MHRTSIASLSIIRLRRTMVNNAGRKSHAAQCGREAKSYVKIGDADDRLLHRLGSLLRPEQDRCRRGSRSCESESPFASSVVGPRDVDSNDFTAKVE